MVEAGSGQLCGSETGYRHEAFFYAGEDDFVAGTAPFIKEGLDRNEPILVAVVPSRIRALRDALRTDADRVRFMDMAELGRNPARIISAWAKFVEDAASHGGLRGIGEPIWPGRSPAELVESQLHEALLNQAVPETTPLWLLCPYDTEALQPTVLDEARRSHPFIRQGAVHQESPNFDGRGAIPDAFTASLPEPPPGRKELAFEADDLARLRRLVSAEAIAAGLGSERTADLLTAVNEVTTNSLRHGGGHGVLRIWTEDDKLICEVSDRGSVDDPLIGRIRPCAEQQGGRGLWLVNQLCDLVQLRSTRQGTTVRMHISRD